MSDDPQQSIELILAGPIFRKTTVTEVNLWLVTSAACVVEPVFSLSASLDSPLSLQIEQQTVNVSESVCIHLQVKNYNLTIYQD